MQTDDLRGSIASLKICVIKFIVSQAHGNIGNKISKVGSVRVLLGCRGWYFFSLTVSQLHLFLTGI